MELPFLKNKKNQAVSGPPAEQVRDPDSYDPDKMLEQVAEELLSAYDRKDKGAMREALRAFVLMIQQEEEAEDASD